MNHSQNLTPQAVLAERRQKARQLADRRYHEIMEKIPEIDTLKAALNATNASLAKLILTKPGNLTEQLQRLRDQNLAAQDRIQELLKENGYPEDYLKIPYTCPKCEDSGYYNGKKCECLEQLTRTLHIKRINETCPLELSDFDAFDLRFYPDMPDENGVVPRSQMEKVFRFCQDYGMRFSPSSQSLLMLGGTGLGKTHLSLAIAKAALKKGYQVIYGSAQDLFRQVEKEHFGKSDKDTLGSLLTCDLLILDDLGAEFESSYYTSCLYNILNGRLGADKPTIISSNLNARQLQDRYSERIVSRLFTLFQLLRFTGKDIRQLKQAGR